MRKLLTKKTVGCVLCAALSVAWSERAQAKEAIGQSGRRPHYALEAEPHLVLGALDPPGVGRSLGLGGGVRATIEIVEHGFIAKLNDSVGIGFGADYLLYEPGEQARGSCERFEAAPNSTQVCVEVSGGGDRVSYVVLPVVLQWNFWLTRRWSVFGEPGVFFYVAEEQLQFSPLALQGGGRYQFSDSLSVSLRLGYPTWSVGISLFL